MSESPSLYTVVTRISDRRITLLWVGISFLAISQFFLLLYTYSSVQCLGKEAMERWEVSGIVALHRQLQLINTRVEELETHFNGATDSAALDEAGSGEADLEERHATTMFPTYSRDRTTTTPTPQIPKILPHSIPSGGLLPFVAGPASVVSAIQHAIGTVRNVRTDDKGNIYQ